MRQVLRHVKADATRADHGHVLAHRLLVTQHVQVAQHLRMVHAFDGGRARCHAGGQDDLVEAPLDQVVHRHTGVELRLHTGQLDLIAVVAQGLVELFLSRNLLGDVELAAHVRTSFEQRHIVTTACGRRRSGQAGRASTHHGHALLRCHRFDLQDRLVAGTRVHQARGDLAAEGVIQASLVAADAGVDLIGTAGRRLVDELGVGQQRTRHGHHVGAAFGQDLLAHFRRVDAVGRDQRDLDLALHLLRHPGKGTARHAGGNGRDAGFVPTDAGVDDGGASGFHRLSQLHHFVKGRAAFHQVQHGQAVDDDEVRAHTLTGAAHDLHREAHAVLVRAAPLVVTLVGARGDEFVDQVAFRAHDLHAVVAGLLGHGCAVRVVIDRAFHLVGGQRARRHRRNRCLDGAGADEARMVGIATKVQDLHGDLATGGVHGIGHHLVLGGLFFRGHAGTTGVRTAIVVGRNAAGYHQGHPTTGTLGIERGHALEAILGLFQAHVHRAHQDTVAQCGETQVKRLQKVGIGAHGNGSLVMKGGDGRLVRHFWTMQQLCNQLHECILGDSRALCNWLHSCDKARRLASCRSPMP